MGRLKGQKGLGPNPPCPGPWTPAMFGETSSPSPRTRSRPRKGHPRKGGTVVSGQKLEWVRTGSSHTLGVQLFREVGGRDPHAAP